MKILPQKDLIRLLCNWMVVEKRWSMAIDHAQWISSIMLLLMTYTTYYHGKDLGDKFVQLWSNRIH